MQIISKAVAWTGLISVPVLLLAASPAPANAGNIGSCAASLIAGGVPKESAASACADASEPNQLSSCVDQIIKTDIKGNDALQACYRVRRPDELASCVTTISGITTAKESPMALDSCQRSLLPQRHAECTLDLAGLSDISTAEAMKSCLAAEIMPGNVSPKSAPKSN
ncbi:MAG: hypothetical protein AAFQ41_03985 [Cyanobacteria bacterium J06623_7]